MLDPARPDFDRRDGRAGRLHRGALSAILQADARAAADREARGRVQAALRPRRPAACLRTYRSRRRRDCSSSRWDRSTARSRT